MALVHDLIILGASARAAAQSALKAGYRPWCADLFADRDLAAMAHVSPCPWENYPQGFIRQIDAAGLPHETPILLTGAMENYPDVVAGLALRHPLLGPSATAMQALRDIIHQPAHQPHIQGLEWCNTRIVASAGWLRLRLIAQPRKWIIKPLASAGGVNIRHARPWTRLKARDPSTCLLQQFVPGISLGVLWRATENQCELLGVTRQIIGDPDFCPAGGYRYAGSIGPWGLTPAQTLTLQILGNQLTQRLGIHGLFGGDLILDRRGRLWPVEFNPRYTASVEVLEKACDFAAMNPSSHPKPAQHIVAKAYIFARRDGPAPDLYTFFQEDEVADVPAIGSPIQRGHPICTLLARGMDEATALQKLRDMARGLYTRLL